MTNKSPATTASPSRREMLGSELFSQRRETFDKHDTVFLPSPAMVPRDDTSTNAAGLKRNAPVHSSMRETRNLDPDGGHGGYRPRKYSENLNSESDSFEHRHGVSERSLRLHKLRKEFLSANMHGSASENTFARVGARASLPVRSASVKYKIDSPYLYKFPFAEPFATPQTVRKVASSGTDNTDGKENADPSDGKNIMEPVSKTADQLDPHQLFEELVKRYSPQMKPVDWSLPPTKPKSISTTQKLNSSNNSSNYDQNSFKEPSKSTIKSEDAVKRNGIVAKNNKNNLNDANSRISLTELEEKNDEVPELTTVHRQIRDIPLKSKEKVADLRIPALLEKMSAECDDVDKKEQVLQNKKRKRSFLDKLLGRNKEK